MKFESVGVTVDCDAEAVDVLAEFWSATMGYTKLLPWVLVDPAGVQPRILFLAVPEPKTVKNRWHLDLYVDHLDKLGAEIERVTTLGATRCRTTTARLRVHQRVRGHARPSRQRVLCVRAARASRVAE